MCGIIGFYSKNVTKEHLAVLQKVMVESSIRGKHASGIAWYDGKTILSVVEPIPIDKLVEEFDFDVLPYGKDKSVSMIAHARYSTSDIKYNQPLKGTKMAIAHNGVISQSDPSEWYSKYGYKCKTKNDSELLLHALESGDDIQKKFPGASIASAILDNCGNVYYIRNKYRPLWKGKISDGIIVASTFDILNRAGVSDIQKIESSDGEELQWRYLQ